MYDFAKFSDANLEECGANVAALGGGASSMEDAPNRFSVMGASVKDAMEPLVGNKIFA